MLSLILWALTLTISVKYVAYVLSADNRGEGGVLALMALAKAKVGASPKKRAAVLFLGLLGAALLYGDGMITPAISVLSAVEGLGMVAPNLKPLVLPLTIAILVLLFSGQRFGTAKVASIFGPLALLWFSVLAGLGVYQMVKAPEVLGAFLPHHAFLFFVNNGAQFAIFAAGVASSGARSKGVG